MWSGTSILYLIFLGSFSIFFPQWAHSSLGFNMISRDSILDP